LTKLPGYVCSSDPPRDDWVDHKDHRAETICRAVKRSKRRVTKIKFIACSLMPCRTAGTLKRYAWGNQRRLTVGGLAHLKARRRVRLSARFRLWLELSLPSRFAFTATCRRYRWTISSPEAPAIRLAVASKAARIFSLTISSASRRALLPPRISFIIRSATTPFASTASIIKELTIRRPLHSCLPRRKSGNGSGLSLINSARE
jgi:hypothetical protein